MRSGQRPPTPLVNPPCGKGSGVRGHAQLGLKEEVAISAEEEEVFPESVGRNTHTHHSLLTTHNFEETGKSPE